MASVEAAPIHQQIVCANVFIRRGTDYLMLRRSPNKRYAPNIVHPVGGKVEPGENALAGAKREAFEETGLAISNVRLRAVLLDIKPVPGEPYDWLVYHFLADYVSGELRETDEGQLVWLAYDEIDKQDLHPSVRPVIHHILDETMGTTFVTYQYAASDGKMITSDLGLCRLAAGVAREPKAHRWKRCVACDIMEGQSGVIIMSSWTFSPSSLTSRIGCASLETKSAWS